MSPAERAALRPAIQSAHDSLTHAAANIKNASARFDSLPWSHPARGSALKLRVLIAAFQNELSIEFLSQPKEPGQ